MIERAKDLERKLGALSQAVIGANLKNAVGNQINMVQAEAKLGCPVNDGELRNSIRTTLEEKSDYISGTCYTNKKHAAYVEFGAGPKGQADHTGISPLVSPSYTQNPWWIHESQIDSDVAEKYGWFKLETQDGIFYQCSGQAAQSFLYPALKNNEERAVKSMGNYFKRKIKETTRT